MGTWLEQPSPSDFDRWEKLVYEERIPPWEAAKQLGFGGSSTFKRTDPARHAALLVWWRDSIEEEDREYVRDKLKDNVDQAMRAIPVFDREGKPTGEYTYRGDVANRSLELLGKTAGMFADRVEVSGGMEVTSPDVAAAIERFTTRVLSLATGRGEDSANGDVAGLGEGGAGVPVAQLDRAPEPG